MKLSRLLPLGFYVSVIFPYEVIASDTHKDNALTVIDESDVSHRKSSGQSGMETVSAAILAALTHNPEIKIAESRLAAVKAEKFRAVGQFLPEIEASTSYTDDALRSQTLQTLQDQDGTTVGVTASQPIFQGLRAVNRFKEATAQVSQLDYSLRAAKQRVAFDAARIHAGVILAREVVGHRIENLALLEKQFEITERRMRAGAQSRTGVEQARMRRAQALVDLNQARAVLAERETAYERIVGYTPPIDLTPDKNTKKFEFDHLENAQAAAFRYNPTLNAARDSIKAAKYAKGAARGEFAPTVTIEGSYFKRYGEDNLMSAQDDEYQVVARLRVPIFRQGRNIAGLRSAAAALSENRAQLINSELSVEEAVARSWRQMLHAGARKIAAAAAIEAATMSVRGLQLEYEAGRRTVIDVLDGQRDLVVARISLSQAQHDYLVSRYELAAATGSILSAS